MYLLDDYFFFWCVVKITQGECTPMYIAAQNGFLPIVHQLIAAKADMEAAEVGGGMSEFM